MYHRIVVGTDGSSTGDRAVEIAGELASLASASIHVVAAYREQERLAAEGVLDRAAGRLESHSLSVTTVSRLGNAADVLLAVAEEVDADLLVIGNRGETGARRYLLGGVADRVAHHAPCSVQIVHAC